MKPKKTAIGLVGWLVNYPPVSANEAECLDCWGCRSGLIAFT